MVCQIVLILHVVIPDLVNTVLGNKEKKQTSPRDWMYLTCKSVSSFLAVAISGVT